MPQGLEPGLGVPVGDERRAQVLEGLAAGDVVVVVVAVDHVLDGRRRDLLDLGQVGLGGLGPEVGDGSVAVTPSGVTTNIDWCPAKRKM